MVEAERAQPRDEVEDRAGIETELVTISTVSPVVSAAAIFFNKRAVELRLADARMAFGIAGDADRADAAASQGAADDGVERAQQRPALGAVAANDENVGDARVAIESREEIVERRHADEIAHGNVRHRLEAGRAQPDRGAERFLCGPVRNGAEINAAAALEHGERCNVGIRRPRRLDGESLHECGDARDWIERRRILNCERGHRSALALQTGRK